MNDKEAKKIVTKFYRNLNSEEHVIWYGHPVEDDKVRSLLVFFLLALILGLLYMYFANYRKEDIFPIMVNLVVFTSLFALLYLKVIFPKQKKESRLYVLTNKKVAILSRYLKGGKQQVHYANITNLEMNHNLETTTLLFYTEDGQIKFGSMERAALEEAHALAVKQMLENGAPAIVRSYLEHLSNKHDLTLINAEDSKGKSILEGRLGDLILELEITGGFPLENLRIELKNIPNPENNSFRIQAERKLNKVQKITKQDLEIGDEETDDTYLLESNDLYFLKTILNDEVRERLNKRANKLKNKIEFGTYQKSGKRKSIKTKFKTDDQVLDAHLLEGNQIEIESREIVDPDLKSTLILNLKINNKVNGQKIANQIEEDFELVYLLAQRVNNYYEH